MQQDFFNRWRIPSQEVGPGNEEDGGPPQV
jgi:hypothetical protein